MKARFSFRFRNHGRTFPVFSDIPYGSRVPKAAKRILNPQIAWGAAHKTLILAGAWLQGAGSLLEGIFIMGIIVISGATHRLSGWITAFAATVIMTVSLVEVSFYINAVQSGVTGNLNGLSLSLALIQAIQHAYVIVPAPTLLIGLGIIILQSRVIPIIFGFLALAFGTVLGVLGFIGTFTPLQQVIDYVLGAQEIWFVAAGIALIVVTGKVVGSSAIDEQAREV
jgi:hypothetical protein